MDLHRCDGIKERMTVKYNENLKYGMIISTTNAQLRGGGGQKYGNVKKIVYQ